MKNRALAFHGALVLLLFLASACGQPERDHPSPLQGVSLDSLRKGFLNPPDVARPWTYWINMDGNFSMEGITADMEAIHAAGLGGVLFMDVDLAMPRGNVAYMSPEWKAHLAHAIRECERLGLEFSLITGPGWTGTGGPWISAEQSMQHLLSSAVNVSGPARFDQVLPVPELQVSQFHRNQTRQTLEQINGWVEDVALFAFPRCDPSIEDIAEKALYIRNPYTSMVGVKPYLPSRAHHPPAEEGKSIEPGELIDLSGQLDAEGRLVWEVPEGDWTLLRMCSRSTGAITRPAPLAGVGLESNKFDTAALNHHFETYIGSLMDLTGIREKPDRPKTGWTTLQFESWEMSSQNWSPNFREEFRKRRGYDLWPYLPVMSGRVVGDPEVSERFLWDLRQTSQELILEYYAGHLARKAHRYGLELHVEPHDMNPSTDMLLAGIGDVPMAEFWANHFNSAFSVHQAASVGHIYGKGIVAAEAFTSYKTCWTGMPYNMKNQGDWAMATGINRFVMVRYTHQPWLDHYPGMAFGPHGTHWDRTQTFWPLLSDYHQYLARCHFMLRQGRYTADICYLLPEGAPNVFVPPPSAFSGDKWTPDRRGYNFDGCPPEALIRLAAVRDGRIVFPGGASYQVLVLPEVETMTPGLLEKLEALLRGGASIVGSPPLKSPSLSGYPEYDEKVTQWVEKIWGGTEVPATITRRPYGKGLLYWGGPLAETDAANYARNPAAEMDLEKLNRDYPEGLFGHDGTRPGCPYPDYEPVARLLRELDLAEDFSADVPLRYAHLQGREADLYFIANPAGHKVKAECRFRCDRGKPGLWDPVTGEMMSLPVLKQGNGITVSSLNFEAYQSFFLVFPDRGREAAREAAEPHAAAPRETLQEIDGPWTLTFDPAWGGPGEVEFRALVDWTLRPEEGIRYFSGIVPYRTSFRVDGMAEIARAGSLYLDLGVVHDLARVILNGKDLGVVWTAPWQVDISDAVREGKNRLEIRVANRWPNRLIGDEFLPYDGVRDGRLPAWLTGDVPRTSGRVTFTTFSCFTKESPLLPSGLLGPVTLKTKSN
jgi:hypothetical protein